MGLEFLCVVVVNKHTENSCHVYMVHTGELGRNSLIRFVTYCFQTFNVSAVTKKVYIHKSVKIEAV